MSRSLAVVHWLPVEMYPPTRNLVRYFADRGWEVSLHTCSNEHGLEPLRHPGVRVHRAPVPGREGLWRRVRAYGVFHAGTLARLVLSKPDVVLYVEPQSALPVFLLSFLRRFRLFIHHHEYHAPDQFLRPGMRLARLSHRLERRRLFERADWISHTNETRLRVFLEDHPNVSHDVGRVLPNYPPPSWFGPPNEAWSLEPPPPLRMVYVGSLSRRDTYIEEMVSWVQGQPAGSVTLDIFAYNLHPETRDYLQAEAGEGVRFFSEGVPYEELPDVLRRYHTGLLLYKATTTNYRHNASNKLFEYLACGLDVVYPARMLGVKSYARTDRWPRVIEVDLETASGPDLDVLTDRGDRPHAPWRRNASDVLSTLEAAMLDNLPASGSGGGDGSP